MKLSKRCAYLNQTLASAVQSHTFHVKVLYFMCSLQSFSLFLYSLSPSFHLLCAPNPADFSKWPLAKDTFYRLPQSINIWIHYMATNSHGFLRIRWAEISLAISFFFFSSTCSMLVCSRWCEKCANKTRNAQSSFTISFFGIILLCLVLFSVPLPQWLQVSKCCLENTFRPIDACWTSLVSKVKETYDDDNDTRTRGIVFDTVVVGHLESASKCPVSG